MIPELGAQGAELTILRGMRQLLRHHPPIVYVEVERDSLAGFGYTPTDLLGLLRALEYELGTVEQSRFLPMMPGTPLPEDGHADVLALHTTHHAGELRRLRRASPGRG